MLKHPLNVNPTHGEAQRASSIIDMWLRAMGPQDNCADGRIVSITTGESFASLDFVCLTQNRVRVKKQQVELSRAKLSSLSWVEFIWGWAWIWFSLMIEVFEVFKTKVS